MKLKKKKKHILTFFKSNQKKFKFYFKPRLFFNNYKNQINNFIVKPFKYSLISLNSIYLDINPILACIKLIKAFLKQFLLDKFTTLFILIFPDFQLTNKPREVRMGRGKGAPGKKVVLLKRNTLIFSLETIDKFFSYYIFKQCAVRLPIKTKIIYKY